jgi:hypothetical protein
LLANAAHAEKRELVLSAYPIAQPLFNKYVYEPFKAKCGCDIVVETGTTPTASPSWWCTQESGGRPGAAVGLRHAGSGAEGRGPAAGLQPS